MNLLRPAAILACSLLAALAACSDDTKETPAPSKGSPTPVVDAQGRPTDLSCPGSPGCEEATGALRVGVATRSITPEVFETYTDLDNNGYFDPEKEPFEDKNGNGRMDGVWLAGFGPGRAATKAHDDIWARVLTFTQGDLSVALVSLDLIGFFNEHVVEIREAARAKGLDFDHIMISTTHVHESKDTMGMWGAAPLVSGIDPEFMQRISDRVIEALQEAKQNERVAKIKAARGEAPQLVNDTRKPKVIDQGIYTLQFLDETSAPFATMVTWGNHPEALGSENPELTSDFPHYLRASLEARYPNSTAVYFNGCLGGLTTTIGIVGCPDADGKETCPQGTFERAEYVGRGAAEAAIDALEGPSAQTTDTLSLAVRRHVFLTSATNSGLALLVSAGALPRKLFLSDGTPASAEDLKGFTFKDLSNPDAPFRISSEVNVIELGPAVIGTVPGELYTELWLARDDGTSFAETPAEGDFAGTANLPPLSGYLPAAPFKFVINNANDALGYIIPKPQWDTKKPYAYEKEKEPQYGEENSVGQEMAPTVVEAYSKLARLGRGEVLRPPPTLALCTRFPMPIFRSRDLLRLALGGLALSLLPACSSCSKTAEKKGDAAPLASTASSSAPGPQPDDPSLGFWRGMKADDARKHAHFMHLDGWRADLFRALLDGGQLPHFSFLLSRGKLSTKVSTVDKSETMKVIESYLTSRRDTYIAGWWQFNRETFAFKNYWLDPVEVINYELGLVFPENPSVFDYLASRGERATSGFGLHRRGVAGRDYTRNFVEGGAAVFKHTYYDQVSATMSSVCSLYEKIGRDPSEKIPALSTSLLAAADEYAHLNGVVNPHTPQPRHSPDEHCVQRKTSKKERASDRFERVFTLIEEEQKAGTVFSGRTLVGEEVKTSPGAGHFTSVSSEEFCFRLPRLRAFVAPAPGPDPSTGKATEQYAEPTYALGMIVIDIQLGRLLNTMRGVRFDCAQGPHCYEPKGDGIEAYLRGKRQENSLFEKTLFVFTGDHGMVDTKFMMAKDSPELRAQGRDVQGSMNVDFIEALNKDLGLSTPRKDTVPAEGSSLGLDDSHLPPRLALPHRDRSWQSPEIQAAVQDSVAWSEAFFKEIEQSIKSSVHRKYWWLLFLGKPILDPRVNAKIEPYKQGVLDALTQIDLAGKPEYVRALREADRAFYNQRVRLIYGGGARNNAELFLPTQASGGASWSQRPSHEQLVGNEALMQALKKNPGVGLIFVRKGNELLGAGKALPARMEISVLDRFGNRGEISVQRDPSTKELLYGYQALSEVDPLGYGELGRPPQRLRTYNEWNDLSVERDHYLHNVVAGMGSYLYSTNSAIGDLTLMHSQGWDFGDNSGGHGGIHKEEKITLMLVSGPGIRSGELMASSRYRTAVSPDGSVTLESSSQPTYPTVVDAAPSLLRWLGHGEEALTRFARSPAFPAQLASWKTAQRAGYPDEFYELLISSLRQVAPDMPLELAHLKPRFRRLFRFMELQEVQRPASAEGREDGNQLRLEDGAPSR